jgi:hypothetical protein
LGFEERAKDGNGVEGISQSTTGGAGVYGFGAATGVIGKSENWVGMYGSTSSPNAAGAVLGSFTQRYVKRHGLP